MRDATAKASKEYGKDLSVRQQGGAKPAVIFYSFVSALGYTRKVFTRGQKSSRGKFSTKPPLSNGKLAGDCSQIDYATQLHTDMLCLGRLAGSPLCSATEETWHKIKYYDAYDSRSLTLGKEIQASEFSAISDLFLSSPLLSSMLSVSRKGKACRPIY